MRVLTRGLVVGALMLSIPLSAFTSRAGAGRALRRLGLFVIPEEVQTPPVLAATQRYCREATAGRAVVDAALEPIVNTIARGHRERGATLRYFQPPTEPSRSPIAATGD